MSLLFNHNNVNYLEFGKAANRRDTRQQGIPPSKPAESATGAVRCSLPNCSDSSPFDKPEYYLLISSRGSVISCNRGALL